jgi:hypothetical protein
MVLDGSGVTLSGASSAGARFFGEGATGCVLVGATLRCWGANGHVLDPSKPPTASILGASDVLAPNHLTVVPTSIAISDTGACLLDTAAQVTCIGLGDHGQLGASATSPASIPIATGALQVVAGATHRCALSSTGVVYCWGGDAHAQIGEASTGPDIDPTCTCTRSQVAVMSSHRYTRIAAHGGGDTTCGVVWLGGTAGTVECWGANDQLQAGVAGGADVVTPTAVRVDSATPLAHVVDVTMGPRTGCATDDEGAVFCWGDADFDPSTPPTDVAVPVVFGGP